MRSISIKITLVLVIVSLVGALFTTIFIQNQTKNAFDNFIHNQDQQVLTQALVDFYSTNNRWQGVDQVFNRITLYGSNSFGNAEKWENDQIRPFNRIEGAQPFVLATDSGLILAGGAGHTGYQPGDTLSTKELKNGIKLESDGELIGWLVVVPFPQPRNNPQQNFLDTLQKALIISSLVTLLIALILGGVLIQSFTRPIRKLANATEAVAGGDIGYQVEIKSRDELGRLAASFNSMSSDLEKSDRARKQMTADIAHDLRTPLSILYGYTEAMSEGKLDGNSDIYQIMHQQAKHLNYLIDDLRILSLLDSGELTFQIQNIDPAIILHQIMAAFQPIAKEKEIEFSQEIMKDLPRVDLDPDRLAQILGNLLTNAIQVLSPGGKVKLSAASHEKNLVIQVTDDGPGITSDDLPNIFNRFYRSDKSRQVDQGSSGMGLAISKKLVEAQGGLISVASEPGVETTFTIRLPTV